MEEEYLGRLFTKVCGCKFTNICPLSNTPNVLTHLVPGFLVDYTTLHQFVLLLVDCIGHYEKDLAVSVFFNLCNVSR